MTQPNIEDICEQLIYDFRGILTWRWDDWVSTFLADFNTDIDFKVRGILEKHLLFLWDTLNIHNAPQGVQDVYTHLGKLRPTQFLFSSDPSNAVFVFCAWWPWDNGSKISLRFAPYNKSLSKQKENKLKGRLMALAGIKM
jgi:hypothetical protein